MTEMRRPELYVPLSVRFATGKTGTAIQRRYGLEGLAVWAAFLAACKLNRPEGEIVFASEPEGWALLGVDKPPGFTLAEFFTYTGKLKKTRKQRSGKLTYVVCTPWGRWTKAQKQEQDRIRKSRKRALSEPDTERTPVGNPTGQESDLEVELEVDIEEPVPVPEPEVQYVAPQPEPDPDNIDFTNILKPIDPSTPQRDDGAGAGSEEIEKPSSLQKRLKEEIDRRTTEDAFAERSRAFH